MVGSILLALALDAWWAGRRDAESRLELIAGLERDLTTSRERVAVAILRVDSAVARTSAFLAVAERPEAIPIDSLRFLLAGALWPVPFAPALSSYEGAVASGTLSLLEGPAVLEAMTDFQSSTRRLDERFKVELELFYQGPVWELRETLGSVGVLLYDPSSCPAGSRSCPYPRQFELGDAGLYDFAGRREVYAAYENWLTLKVNIREELGRIQESVDRALVEVRRLRSP